MSEIKKTGPRSPHPTGQNTYPAGSIRQRILEAAFNLFSESGFSPTSLLDIVTRARVSKRDLYALFRNKHAVLAACIHERTEHMRRPLDTAAPIPQTRDALTKLLIEFGVSILKTVCRPEVREAPTEREIETRACSATETLMAWRKRCTNLS